MNMLDCVFTRSVQALPRITPLLAMLVVLTVVLQVM